MADEWKQYRRVAVAELTEWYEGFNMIGVSVSDHDAANGSPKTGDMIARNPTSQGDRWLVAADYFAANFEPVSPSADVAASRRAYLLLIARWAAAEGASDEDMRLAPLTVTKLDELMEAVRREAPSAVAAPAPEEPTEEDFWRGADEAFARVSEVGVLPRSLFMEGWRAARAGSPQGAE